MITRAAARAEWKMSCFNLRPRRRSAPESAAPRSRRRSKLETAPIKALSKGETATVIGRKAPRLSAEASEVATEAGTLDKRVLPGVETETSTVDREKEPSSPEPVEHLVLTQTDGPDEEGRNGVPTNGDSLRRLSQTQRDFLRGARRRAKKASDAALPQLAQRFEKLGFAHDALARVLQYIRETAPIVIHFNPAKAFKEGSTVLEGFLNDTHYRNQFETQISSGSLGSSRDEGEKRLFAGMYHQGKEAIPEERPKYGALNVYQRPVGSAGAYSYGQCLFELCSDVRKRATFTFGDSLGSTAADTLATCDHFAHILSRFDDAALRSLVAKAGDRVCFLVEAQIHGPVEFRCDIKELRYSEAERAKTREGLEALAKKNAFTANTY